jgi:hypothetical protein
MKRTAWTSSVAIAGIMALECIVAGQSLAECPAKEPPRPVHRTYIQRDVVEPGVYEVGRSPAVYGWICKPGEPPRRVLLRPYKNATQFQRPYIAWSRERVTVIPEPDC